MSNTTQASSGGISFCGLLTIVLITLKLTHVIDWSWVWVLAPLWIGLAFALGIFAIIALLGVLALLVAWIAGVFTERRK